MFELQEIQQFIEFSNLLIKCDTGTSGKAELKINEDEKMNRKSRPNGSCVCVVVVVLRSHKMHGNKLYIPQKDLVVKNF